MIHLSRYLEWCRFAWTPREVMTSIFGKQIARDDTFLNSGPHTCITASFYKTGPNYLRKLWNTVYRPFQSCGLPVPLTMASFLRSTLPWELPAI